MDFENIIGFVIFLVIAGSSILSKMREQRKAEIEREQRQQRPRKRPEDLPEATRRMLYGETGVPPKQGQAPGYDIPTARPKQGGAPPMPRRAPTQAEQVPDAEALPGGIGPDEERRVRELQRRLQQQLEAQRKEAEFARQKAERERALKQRQQQAKLARRQAPPAAAEAEGAAVGAASAAAQQRKPQEGYAPVAAARRAPAVDVRDLLANPVNLRQGIILTEILMPPVSMR